MKTETGSGRGSLSLSLFLSLSHLIDRLKNRKFDDNDFHEWRATPDTRHYNFSVFDYSRVQHFSTLFLSLSLSLHPEFSINRYTLGRSYVIFKRI